MRMSYKFHLERENINIRMLDLKLAAFTFYFIAAILLPTKE